MQTINQDQLNDMLKNDESIVIFNVLSKGSFEEKHIPQSFNVPVNDRKFVDKIKKRIGSDFDKKVVVYCKNKECDASPIAAKKLEQAGFKNVYDFEGGIQEWEESGLPLEGREVH